MPNVLKLRLVLVLSLLPVAVSLRGAELEFIGYITLAKDSRFILSEPEDRKTSGWLSLGQSFRDYTLVAFDPKAEVLSLKKGGTLVSLPLRLSRVRDGRALLIEMRSFFQRAGTITAKDVEDRFGAPPRYAQLLLQDADKDVTREHSWWHYPLAPGENIGVQMDGARVQAVYRFYPDPNGGLLTELIRAAPGSAGRPP